MNQAQRNDLLIGFNLYEGHIQKAMINEYLNLKNGEYCKKNSLFDYLKERFEVEGCWKEVPFWELQTPPRPAEANQESVKF